MCGESQKKGNHLVNFREMFVLVLGVCVQEANTCTWVNLLLLEFIFKLHSYLFSP